MNNFNYPTLSPFKWFVLQNFPFIEYDFDALTNWQLFCKLGKEMNKIIEKVNLSGEQIENLTNAFNELESYVNNYFENLDIQDEINTKLDEMAESGELAELIAQYLESQAIIGFNNISSLANATNLADGSFAKTYGKLTYNDGMGAFYKIRTRTNADIPDNDNIVVLVNTENLVAEKIKKPDIFYNNIYYEDFYSNNTHCYITHIPLNDENNNQIDFDIEPAGVNPITNKTMSPNEHARFFNTNVTINASLSIEIDGVYKEGIAISKGVVIHDFSMEDYVTDEYKYIAFKRDRSVTYYQANQVTAQQMIEDGVYNAVLCFGTIVENGQLVNLPNHYQKFDIDQFLGVKDDKEILILTCDGRNSSNKGLTGAIGGQMLIDMGCTTVFCLDSGGSTSTNIKGYKVNMNYDNDNTADRVISYVFDVKKKNNDDKLFANCYSHIGKSFMNLSRQILPLINKREPLIRRSKKWINQESIQTNAQNGSIIKNISGSEPTTDIFTIDENGIIHVNLPDTHTSNLPYQIHIYGHITIHNTTGANTSHFLNIMEIDPDTNNESVEAVYRQTIPDNDNATITFDDIFNNKTKIHNYALRVNANNPNNTEILYGKLYLEYIPNVTNYL